MDVDTGVSVGVALGPPYKFQTRSDTDTVVGRGWIHIR
jgi:hypothetical protein